VTAAFIAGADSDPNVIGFGAALRGTAGLEFDTRPRTYSRNPAAAALFEYAAAAPRATIARAATIENLRMEKIDFPETRADDLCAAALMELISEHLL
jgi:hypothetical protein